MKRIRDASRGRDWWMLIIYALPEGHTEGTGYTRRAVMTFAASYL